MLNLVDTLWPMTYNEHRILCHGTEDIHVAGAEIAYSFTESGTSMRKENHGKIQYK